MIKPYIASPPQRERTSNILKMVVTSPFRLILICLHVITPYKNQPESINDLTSTDDWYVNDGTLDYSKSIYEEVEKSRNYIEEKAKSTFALISFLFPLLGALFLFLFDNKTSQTEDSLNSLYLLSIPTFLLVLSLISIIRAVSVKPRQKLFLRGVLDFEKDRILSYNIKHHVKGLLWCSSMNQAMNDHIAEFVKSAQILAAISVLSFVIAIVHFGLLVPPSPTKVEVVGEVFFNAKNSGKAIKEISKISDGIDRLKNELKSMSDGIVKKDDINMIKTKLERLETQIGELSLRDLKNSPSDGYNKRDGAKD